MVRRSMANPDSRLPFSTFSDPISRQADEYMATGGGAQGWPSWGPSNNHAPNEHGHMSATDSHAPSRCYNNQTPDAFWETKVFPLPPEHNSSYHPRGSIPSDAYTSRPISQSLPSSGSSTGPQMSQGPWLSYQQHLTQPTTPSPIATSMAPGGYTSDLHFGSSPRTPEYISRSPHPYPYPQPNPRFQTDMSSPSYVGQECPLDTSYVNSGGGTTSHNPRSSSRMYRFQPGGAWQVSGARDTAEWMEGAGSPVDFSPVASRSGTRTGEFATYPNEYSDPHRIPLNEPKSGGGTSSEVVQRDRRRKETQKLKKQEERKAESVQFERVRELLELGYMTKIETLEAVIRYFGRSVPARRNEPTPTLPGRARSGRAAQVSSSRQDISQLFTVVTECMGYHIGAIPKREQILKDVGEVIRRNRPGKLQPPGPQWGEGTSKN